MHIGLDASSTSYQGYHAARNVASCLTDVLGNSPVPHHVGGDWWTVRLVSVGDESVLYV